MKAVSPDEYLVTWHIDVDLADNPTQAALKALVSLCGEDAGLAGEVLDARGGLYFVVYDHEGNATEVDLTKEN